MFYFLIFFVLYCLCAVVPFRLGRGGGADFWFYAFFFSLFMMKCNSLVLLSLNIKHERSQAITVCFFTMWPSGKWVPRFTGIVWHVSEHTGAEKTARLKAFPNAIYFCIQNDLHTFNPCQSFSFCCWYIIILFQLLLLTTQIVLPWTGLTSWIGILESK